MSALRMLACGKRYRACFDAAGDEGFERFGPAGREARTGLKML